MKKKVTAKKKPAVRKKVSAIEEENTLLRNNVAIVLSAFPSNMLMDAVFDRLNTYIHYFKKGIESDQSYVDNETDSYRLQKQEARTRIKNNKKRLLILEKQ